MDRIGRPIRFSSEDVAEYMVDRLMPVRQFNWKKRKNKGSSKKKAPVVPLDQAKENRVAELAGLVLEVEDIFKQIRFDEATLEGRFDSAALDRVMEVLDEAGIDESPELRGLAGRIMPSQGIEGSVEEARGRLIEARSKIADFVGDSVVREGYKAKLTKTIDVIRSARNIDSFRRVSERSELARMELLAQRNRENMSLTSADAKTLRKYDFIRRKAQEKADKLMAKDDVYYEAKRRLLLEYRRQLLSDGFVETPTVKHEIMKIISHLQLGIPVLLRGHLGAGKTEVALHVSRKYFGCEPEFISGSEEATKYDIYGRTQIGSRSEDDKRREFKARMDEFQRMNPDAARKEVKEVEKQFYQAIIVKGLTTSFFQYGPLVRAMKEGKPLVIDEMDGIPHSIIMRLNHVLTRRPGDSIKVQEDGGEDVTVNKGFCVMATGNIKSFRYKREELDAAFLSRWWSDDIVYPPQDETYEILVASLLDRRGNLQAGNVSDLDEIKRLTMAATEIQKIFSGEHLDYLGDGADAARKIPASLKKSVLSLRHLWNIVRPWKARNFDKSLENYILNEFIKPSVAEDQVYLVQLFCRFRFYKNWKADGFGIPGLTDGKLSAFQGKSKGQPAE
jgi:MoxR-like ATPase